MIEIYIYISLDILVFSIAEYFNELCPILSSLLGKSKYKQRVKILSDTTHQNIYKLFIIQLLFFLPSFSAHFS